jgi:hypothetical protein
MTHSLRRFVSGMLTLSTALSMTAFGLIASGAQAGQLTSAKDTLSDSRSLHTTNSTIAFNVASTNALKAIRLEWRITASGGASFPEGIGLGTATLTSITGGANTTDWTGVADGSSQHQELLTNSNAAGTGALSGGATITVALGNITNNTSTPSGTACDTIANSETCYIRITTYSDAAATLAVDTAVTSYTVITPITVSSIVDPTLTFAVGGVTGTTIDTNDTRATCGTINVVNTTTTTVPFGNLQLAVAKCGQLSLQVITNSSNGYNTYAKFFNDTDSANMMIGTNPVNNIDPFTSAFTAPGVFSAPTGNTPSVNTGFLGYRTSNANIGAFATNNYYGAPFVGAGSGDTVMTKATPDDGSVLTYITLKTQVNANQPADAYTGTLFFSVVPSY